MWSPHLQLFAVGDENKVIHHKPNFFNVFFFFLGEGKMNPILYYDWLTEQARWSYLAHSGLPTVSREKNFPKSHITNSLLTIIKPRSRRLGGFLLCTWFIYLFFLVMSGSRPKLPLTANCLHRMMSSSANYRPFLSSFHHIPPQEGFVKLAN